MGKVIYSMCDPAYGTGVHACVRTCVRSCVRACVPACVRACVWARAHLTKLPLSVYCALIATKRCIAAQVFDPLDSSRNESSASFRWIWSLYVTCI